LCTVQQPTSGVVLMQTGSTIAYKPLLGRFCLIRQLWGRYTTFSLPKYFPDGGYGNASLVYQPQELQSKLLHFVGRLGDMVGKADLPQFGVEQYS
jgi:hypothetical protein